MRSTSFPLRVTSGLVCLLVLFLLGSPAGHAATVNLADADRASVSSGILLDLSPDLAGATHYDGLQDTPPASPALFRQLLFQLNRATVDGWLATARAASGMTTSTHGSTFGGNPLASAVANAVLDVMLEDGFLDRVVERGRYLARKLEDLAGTFPGVIGGTRGEGLMLGVKCIVPHLELSAKLRENGLLSVPAADNIVRLLPPMTISEEEIDIAIDMIGESCRAMTT